MKISNYDEFKYDYKSYWKGRDYENLAESYHLEKILNDKHGNWFIDIGGSFGRLLPHYYHRHKHSVIVDYSLLTLQKNLKEITKEYPNTILISANAYKLPFKDNTFDAGLMVRVLHHIENPTEYFTEVSRILAQSSLYIQEFANKLHFKAIIKNTIRMNLKFFSLEKYQQPSHGNYEGTEGQETLFYNFHPKSIKEQMEKVELKVVNRQGVSFLRIPRLKTIIGERNMYGFEKALQTLFRGIYFAPSIFYTTIKSTSNDDKNRRKEVSLLDILACPQCKGELKVEGNRCSCNQCSKEYLKKEGVWDFRVQ